MGGMLKTDRIGYLLYAEAAAEKPFGFLNT